MINSTSNTKKIKATTKKCDENVFIEARDLLNPHSNGDNFCESETSFLLARKNRDKTIKASKKISNKKKNHKIIFDFKSFKSYLIGVSNM